MFVAVVENINETEGRGAEIEPPNNMKNGKR